MEKSVSMSNGRQNIILIMSDDLGYEVIGANGGSSYKTPHIDSLAESGMRFDNAHVMPLCTPTRVSLMTGKYNFRNYIGFGLIDPNEITESSGNNCNMQWNTKWFEIPRDDKDLIGFITKVQDVLYEDKSPSSSENCNVCKFKKEIKNEQ